MALSGAGVRGRDTVLFNRISRFGPARIEVSNTATPLIAVVLAVDEPYRTVAVIAFIVLNLLISNL